jgi:ABC-type cobalamin/Fe3+-siderophores transport system ATPase subunit
MTPQAEPVFSIHGGWFGYRHGNTTVLEDIDLAMTAGKFYGLIGPNGSGKTTLLDLMASTLKPSRGTVLFQGRPITGYRRQELARMLAFVPQDFALGFDYSVFDVVLMGRHPHIPRFSSPAARDLERVEEALALMDITHLRDRAATNLSGGEKQRVIVARALAQDTPVLILDEATSNLDIRHTIEIMRVVSDRVKQKAMTVVAAIHDLNLAAAFCDELIVVKAGRIVAQGPVRDILTDPLIREVFSVEGHVRIQPETMTLGIDYRFRKDASSDLPAG